MNRCTQTAGCRQTGLSEADAEKYCACEYGHAVELLDAARDMADKTPAIHETLETAIVERDDLKRRVTVMFGRIKALKATPESEQTPAMQAMRAGLTEVAEHISQRLAVLHAQFRMFAEGTTVAPDGTRLTEVGELLMAANRMLFPGRKGKPIVLTAAEQIIVERINKYARKLGKTQDRNARAKESE